MDARRSGLKDAVDLVGAFDVLEHTRECLALAADTSLSGLHVARELDGVIRLRGRPGTIVFDNVLCLEAALGFGQ